MKTKLLATTAGIIVFAGLPGLAFGQVSDTSAPAGEETDEQAPNKLDVVLVTAQKRQQDILDVGATVSAIGAQTIEESRITTMDDLPSQVPNLDIRNQAPGTLPVITIRGVGLNDFSNTNNPSAGVYIDGVYLSSLGLLSFDFFDLERIEVLKGPQGTLYGRNSTAGAINFITAKPDFDSPETKVLATYGNYDTYEVEGVTNLPVSDTLAFRLGARIIRQDEGMAAETTKSRSLLFVPHKSKFRY